MEEEAVPMTPHRRPVKSLTCLGRDTEGQQEEGPDHTAESVRCVPPLPCQSLMAPGCRNYRCGPARWEKPESFLYQTLEVQEVSRLLRFCLGKTSFFSGSKTNTGAQMPEKFLWFQLQASRESMCSHSLNSDCIVRRTRSIEM